VDQTEGLSGAVEDSHHPKLGHDVAHRSAGRVHVVNKGGEPGFILIDHNAHATSTGSASAGTRSRTLGDERGRHKRGGGSAPEQRHRRFAPAIEDVVRRPEVLTVLRSRGRVGESHDAHARAQGGLDPGE